MPRQARAAEVERPTRSGPVRPAATPHPTARATTAARPRPLHPAPLSLVARVGGDAAEVLAEVRRRLDVTPRLAALIATAASAPSKFD